jgi:hypothetical protein
MRRVRETIWVCGLFSLSLAAGAAHAQSEATTAPGPDSVAPAPDSTPVEGTQKKGGLFGKAQKFVGNKALQQVAKTVACNMVPGGQVVAGAIDAASSKNVGGAAAGATGAAAGQTCMPGGMGGAPVGAMGAGGGVPGMPGVAGAAGAAGVGEAAGLTEALGAAGLAGTMVGGVGTPLPGGMPEGAMGHGAVPGMPAPEEIAGCLGMTVEQYLDFTDPTRGQARPLTKDEMKRQGKAAKKMDMGRYQTCMMQQQATRMTATSQTMVQSSMPAPGHAVAEGNLTEAPGKNVTLSSDLASDLAKGRTVVKDIDWLAGGGEVSEVGTTAFTDAMAKLGAAITKAGGTYRADIYLDKRYEDVAIAALGSARLKVVLASLEGAGIATGVVTRGKVKKDKNPRLEIVKAKK